MNGHKLNQVVAPIMATVSNALSFLEQINALSGIRCATVGLANTNCCEWKFYIKLLRNPDKRIIMH